MAKTQLYVEMRQTMTTRPIAPMIEDFHPKLQKVWVGRSDVKKYATTYHDETGLYVIVVSEIGIRFPLREVVISIQGPSKEVVEQLHEVFEQQTTIFTDHYASYEFRQKHMELAEV